jgi:hypothetical protein
LFFMETSIRNRIDENAHEKAVGKRRQGSVGGQRVCRAQARAQWTTHAGVSADEGALVEDAGQRVQDGGRALKHLVEKDDAGFGEYVCRVGLDQAGAQLRQIDRAEDLARFSVKRPRKYSRYLPLSACATRRTASLFAVSGGPATRMCSPAMALSTPGGSGACRGIGFEALRTDTPLPSNASDLAERFHQGPGGFGQ